MSDEAPPIFSLQVEHTPDAALVRCSGRLITGVTDMLYRRIKELIPKNKRIVLDLTDLTHMDSTGLGTLVRLYVSARSAGCTLELINLSQGIRKVLALTNLLEVFSVIGEHHIKLG